MKAERRQISREERKAETQRRFEMKQEKKKPKCQKASGKHRYRYEIPAGSSKTAGRNENGAQADQPGGTGGGVAAQV